MLDSQGLVTLFIKEFISIFAGLEEFRGERP